MNKRFRQITAVMVVLLFLTQSLGVSSVYGQNASLGPTPLMSLSPAFNPAVLRGLKVDLANPFHFNFILDNGQANLSGEALKNEGSKLIKYFLASLTLPENDLWVNLSPYEKDRIIPNEFGSTEMGRQLLSEDYLLKQLSATLLHPDTESGKKFWEQVKNTVQAKFGSTPIPTKALNRIWILPQKAVVYQDQGAAFVGETRFKVMLEDDYKAISGQQQIDTNVKDAEHVSTEIFRQTVLPLIETEVNEGKNFASLRQIYHSLILAAWYKKTLKQSILSQVYVDQKKVAGIQSDDKEAKQKIYEQYLETFKKGVYNLIREDVDETTGETIPRKYFSGGVTLLASAAGVMQTLPLSASSQVKTGSLLEFSVDAQGVDQQASSLSGEGEIQIEFDRRSTTSPQSTFKVREEDKAFLLSVVRSFWEEQTKIDPRLAAYKNFSVRQFKTLNQSNVLFKVRWLQGDQYTDIVIKASQGEASALTIENQAKILKQLQSPYYFYDGVYLDPRQGKNRRYLVMPDVPGDEIHELISQRVHLLEIDVINVGIKLAKVLQQIHARHVIFRDLSPSNVIVDNHGEVHLYDFDASMQDGYDWDRDILDLKNTILNGTLEDGFRFIMDPQKRPKPDVQSDIYAYGMMLLYMQSGNLSIYYTDETIGQSLQNINNPNIRNLIARALGPREKRYQSMDEVLQELEGIKPGSKVEEVIKFKASLEISESLQRIFEQDPVNVLSLKVSDLFYEATFRFELAKIMLKTEMGRFYLSQLFFDLAHNMGQGFEINKDAFLSTPVMFSFYVDTGSGKYYMKLISEQPQIEDRDWAIIKKNSNLDLSQLGDLQYRPYGDYWNKGGNGFILYSKFAGQEPAALEFQRTVDGRMQTILWVQIDRIPEASEFQELLRKKDLLASSGVSDFPAILEGQIDSANNRLVASSAMTPEAQALINGLNQRVRGFSAQEQAQLTSIRKFIFNLLPESLFQKVMGVWDGQGKLAQRVLILAFPHQESAVISALFKAAGILAQDDDHLQGFILPMVNDQGQSIYYLILDDAIFQDPAKLITTFVHELFGHIIADELYGKVEHSSAEIRAYTIEQNILNSILASQVGVENLLQAPAAQTGITQADMIRRAIESGGFEREINSAQHAISLYQARQQTAQGNKGPTSASSGVGERQIGDRMRMQSFLRNHPEAVREGWWISFDVDRASQVNWLQRNMLFGQLNVLLINILGEQKPVYFGTSRSQRSNSQEEGFVYLPENISLQQLEQILVSLKDQFTEQTKFTMTIAAMSAQNVLRVSESGEVFNEKEKQLYAKTKYPSGLFYKVIERVLEDKLREGKGPKNSSDLGYGDKVVFYSASSGIVNFPATLNLEAEGLGADVKPHLEREVELRDLLVAEFRYKFSQQLFRRLLVFHDVKMQDQVGALIEELILNAQREFRGKDREFHATKIQLGFFSGKNGKSYLKFVLKQPRIGDEQWAKIQANAKLDLAQLKDYLYRSDASLFENAGGGFRRYAHLAEVQPTLLQYEKSEQGELTTTLWTKINKIPSSEEFDTIFNPEKLASSSGVANFPATLDLQTAGLSGNIKPQLEREVNLKTLFASHSRVQLTKVFMTNLEIREKWSHLIDELILNVVRGFRGKNEEYLKAKIHLGFFNGPEGKVYLKLSVSQPTIRDEEWSMIEGNAVLDFNQLQDINYRGLEGLRKNAGGGFAAYSSFAQSQPAALQFERAGNGQLKTTLWAQIDRIPEAQEIDPIIATGFSTSSAVQDYELEFFPSDQGLEILSFEKPFLKSVINKIQESVKAFGRAQVKVLSDNGVNRAYVVDLDGEKFVIKRAKLDVYNQGIADTWSILNLLNPDGNDEDFARPILTGVEKFDSFSLTNAAYLVTNFIEGEDLFEVVKQRESFTRAEVLKLALEFVRIVGKAHKHNIIIRDLRPANIRIKPDGRVALYDFDVSLLPQYDWVKDVRDLKSSLRNGNTEDGWEARTTNGDRSRPDQLSDIYSIGITLLYAATRSSRFSAPAKEQQSVLDNLKDEELRVIIAKAIGPRTERYKSMAEFAEALKNLKIEGPDFLSTRFASSGVEQFDLKLEMAIGPKMRAVFKNLNQGVEPKILSVMSESETFTSHIAAALKALPDNKYVILTLNRHIPENLSQEIFEAYDYQILVDQRSRFVNQMDRLSGGIVSLSEYEVVLNFSVIPKQNKVIVHFISVGNKQPLLGKGLASELFSNLASILEQHFPGMEITLASKEAIDRNEGEFLVIPHFMEKHFGAIKINEFGVYRGVIKNKTTTIADIAFDTSSKSSELLPGGIDLREKNLNMDIRGQGGTFNLPVHAQDMQNIHIDGLVPVIINITPINNLPAFWGLSQKTSESLYQSASL